MGRRPKRRAAANTSRGKVKRRLLNRSESNRILDLGNGDEGGKRRGRSGAKSARRPKDTVKSLSSMESDSADAEYNVSQDFSSGSAVDSESPKFESSESEHDNMKKKSSKKKKTAPKTKKMKAKKLSKQGSRGAGRREVKWNEAAGAEGALEWQVWEEEFENWGPWGDNGDIELENLVKKQSPLEQQDPSSDLLMPLLPFQKEWLAWSLKQENSQTKGGILADEMGMGKTIQAISLILKSRSLQMNDNSCEASTIPEKCHSPVISDFVQESIKSSSTAGCKQEPSGMIGDLRSVKATLVICPLVAVIQWRNEIARFTSNGSVKVLIYHGPRRGISFSDLAGYDIVLTTYAIVEAEHRKNVMPDKEKCKWCEKQFYPDRLSVHLMYFCGPTAKKSEKQAKQLKKNPRLQKGSDFPVKGKKGKLMQSEKLDEGTEEEELTGKISTKRKRYAGKSGKTSPKKARKWNKKGSVSAEVLKDAVQIALESPQEDWEVKTQQKSKGSSFLHSVKWMRIVLDEAHSIKDRRCSTSKAVFALQSSFKWALSGTPLQNRVGELYSLVRFLEIHPYSYYFCRQCDCKSLDYRFVKDWAKCDLCNHGPLQHFCWWNKFVANPIKKWGYVNDGLKAMMLLKYKILDSTLLRRTKTERAADLALSPRTTFLRRDAFDAREEDFYQALYTQSQSQFNTYVSSGTLLNNYAHIFDLLTRLRQAVDHPYLVVYSATASRNSGQHNFGFDSTTIQECCSICHDPLEDAITTACKHSFCRSCIQEYISATGGSDGVTPACPSCQKLLTIDFKEGGSTESSRTGMLKGMGYKRTSILHRIELDEFQTSTKIEALKEEVMAMLQNDGAAKAIVFSQFTSMLDLIGFSLKKWGIHCVKLDGSMSMVARDQMIETFKNDSDCKVFLMSLKAGGVALNLTVASHVFLMDPWWNPAVEQQAQDRIHRIGQYKPIKVTRFIIENTIEERILKLQEKKQLVFEGTVGGSSDALGRLTEDDLRFLFTN
ncbi:hypothetical protein O6H91_Y228800 [Diphasiastrum complanatum]|nr:hypothetical protein O6H91_Y228800 [Diphasiastrum complanatum]KAJ7294837.1 hypothetical protein O6H91_Y228800 [Diphasiastrum complanatum]KAJ7294838.1 hypothetical protein O6H91_Y228800 [Diphasiastrum complanatum]KAJ7294841.1 hypothetical protein O6H91_Y228800 [Diphasiastrum complanatum]KAJ7294842.1 hypothetical protein O6H91_Y228800 [Diphasiastrum complanatum]